MPSDEIMATLNVILYSAEKSKRIAYSDEDGIMTSEIEQTLLRECDVKELPHGGARIEVCDKTRQALLALESKYDLLSNHRIRQLYCFIAKMKDGECFCFFNEEKSTSFDRRVALDCLHLHKKGLMFCAMIHNRVFEHYCKMDLKYTFISYGHDGLEVRIGEEDKNKRVCRFCGRTTRDGASFEHVAHAVQEALGNKKLFCYEECDACNNSLAPIEDQFRIMMDFRRTIFQIPRKNSAKAAKVVGKDFIILPDKVGAPQLYIMQEAVKNVDTVKPFMHRFELKEPIVNEQMYKAICKMVIDILPAEELRHFANTISWIKSKDFMPDSLPSIWFTVLTTKGAIYKQPALDVFINNKNTQPNAPYCTAVIWIYDIAYLFVMPFVDVDAGRCKYDKNLDAHISEMKQWMGTKNWYRQDTTNFRNSQQWVNWLVDVSLPNIHLLPGTDAFFEECKAKVDNTQDVPMPEVRIEDVKLEKINKVWFESLYDGQISDKDLTDITQYCSAPVFKIDADNEQVRVMLECEANDTTGTIPFFRFGLDINLHVAHFCDYIQVGNSSLAFHYQLRDILMTYALGYAELQMRSKRIGTPFEKCTLDKTFPKLERLLGNSVYILPAGNGSYIRIEDWQIHSV